jgi:hypothetical protein
MTDRERFVGPNSPLADYRSVGMLAIGRPVVQDYGVHQRVQTGDCLGYVDQRQMNTRPNMGGGLPLVSK